MPDRVADNKYVELTYKVIDERTGHVLTLIEYPLGYVHGVNTILAPQVMQQLEGRSAGDIIEVPIDCNELYGPRDESLVITEPIANVPAEYREVGTAILMESERGHTRTFYVTRADAKTVTLDGNNPLCGRRVIFRLEILTVRDATEEEILHGGKVETPPEVDGARAVPL